MPKTSSTSVRASGKSAAPAATKAAAKKPVAKKAAAKRPVAKKAVAKRAAKTPPAKRLPRTVHGPAVVDALYTEHRYAARLLDLLAEQRAALSRGEPIDREAAIGAMTYLTQHTDSYHHPREDAMFARLVKRDPRLAGRIAEIERGHRTLGSSGRQLLAALQRLKEGSRAGEAGAAARMGDYVGALREHMTVEERDLFPRARQVLEDDDLAAIDRAFRTVTDPLFEASVREAYAAYHPVVRYLAERPSLRTAIGLLDAFYASASTLGDTLFGGAAEESTRAAEPSRARAAGR